MKQTPEPPGPPGDGARVNESTDGRLRELAERREIKRYVLRLFAIIALGALGMVALGLYLYRSLDAQRGETTRRIPIVKQVDAQGKVQYVPHRPAALPSATPDPAAERDDP